MLRPALLLAALLAAAGPAVAATPAAAPIPAAAALADPAADPIEAWRGRFCTAPGCGREGPAGAGHAAGFAAAALGALALARRRRPS